MTEHTFPVPIPFEGDQPLVLDPGTLHREITIDESMSRIVDFIVWDEDELPRIMRAAVILHAAGAGTFGQCLDTAIIWERG